MSKYILLTGATGLVGRYLIRDLLLDGHRLAVVVRAGKKETVQQRIETILQMWDDELAMRLPRPVVLEGDVTEPDLGLDKASKKWIAKNCSRVLHNAAVLTFTGADRSGEPWRTNLHGTENLLKLCEELGLSDWHYVSTAYVCGSREGVIREDELACGQAFRNDYEESKFLAETMVREAKFIKQLTVYRPAVIAGDSRTGYTSTYHGLYMYLQLMAVILRYTEPDANGVKQTNIRLTMTGDEPRNIVPVDWVSQAICRVISTPAAWGGTYHLSPTERVTPRQIVEAGYRFFNSAGLEFCGRDEQKTPPAEDASPAEKALYDSKTVYEAYEDSDPVFDTTQLQRFTADLPCPPLDAEMLHRFIAFGELDNWGRRKPPALEIPCWAHEVLPGVAAELISQRLRSSLKKGERMGEVGIEVTGPGGGQWRINLSAGVEQAVLEPGLPSDSAPILRISSDDLLELVSKVEENQLQPSEGTSGTAIASSRGR